MAAKLIVHIGLHKTGSSSIQKALNNQRDVLLNHGIYIPQTGGVGSSGALHNIARQLNNDNKFDAAKGDISALRKELTQVDQPAVVISAEDLSKIDGSDKKYRKLKKLADGLGRELHVVGYVRDYTSCVNSAYMQQIKTFANDMTFADFARREVNNERWFYDRVFTPFERIADVVSVRPYGGDVVDDFFRLIGADFDLPASPRENQGVGPMTLLAYRVLYGHYTRAMRDVPGRPNISRMFRTAAIRRAADELGWNEERFWGFTPEDAAAMHERCVERDAAFLDRHAIAFGDPVQRPANEILWETLGDRRDEFVAGIGRIVVASGHSPRGADIEGASER